MNRISRTVAVLLLMTLAVVLPGVQAYAMPAGQPAHPAGCHSHMPVPAPAHTSYLCCISGHHQAVPGTSFSLRPLVALCDLASGEDLSPGSVVEARSASSLSSASPPGAAPLRI